VVVLGLGLLSGGCAVSGHLGSLFGNEKDDAKAYAKADATGSVASPAAPKASTGLPPETDLAYARAAVADVLTRGGKDASAPWENPRTGARGTVTPIASAYTMDGAVCHDFLASYLQSGAEAWLQGEACRLNKGKWEIKSLRPWKRS
jgi:surface antigen